MKAKKINNAKKNNVKEINECTKIGDVAMVHGFKSTMVNVERKVFETIAWTWDYDSDCYPCSTKKEALEAAKELYSNPKEHVIKARFSICLKSDMECWEIDHEVPTDTKIGAAPIDEDDTDEEETTTEANANNRLIELNIWNNISNLESTMDSVFSLTYEMAYEWNWSFDDAKKHLLSEADDILDTYVDDLKEVDEELAGKVETCIKNIVEEVKPIDNNEDFDWDEFNNYDIEDLIEEVKALIAKHDAGETATEETATKEADAEEITPEENMRRILAGKDYNTNSNYATIRDYLLANGEGVSYTRYGGEVMVERSRYIRVDGIVKVFTMRQKWVSLSSPKVKVSYTHNAGVIEGGHFEFSIDHETSVEYGYMDENEICDAFDVNERCAELFAKAIKNGDVVPLPIKNGDDEE